MTWLASDTPRKNASAKAKRFLIYYLLISSRHAQSLDAARIAAEKFLRLPSSPTYSLQSTAYSLRGPHQAI